MSKTEKTVHAPSTEPERTLCGLAFDAHESGDWHEKVKFARLGNKITCEECKHVIDFVQDSFYLGKYIG